MLCKHWNLLVIEILVLYFYFKKYFWESNKPQFNSKPDQQSPKMKINAQEGKKNCKNEKLLFPEILQNRN